MRTITARLGVLAASALTLVAAACGGSGSPAPSSSAPAPTTSATSKAAAPKPKPEPKKHKRPKKHKKHKKHTVAKVNPLTGVGGVPHAPLIAVKIDDTAPGRPQVGIDKADVVYIEAVEGGLTRLAAIYGTHKPVVGYVRSTRPSDPELLRQYGQITEAFSGGARDALPRVRWAGLKGWSNDGGAPFYRRVPRSESSYINLTLNLRNVARHSHTPPPKSIGWTFAKKLTGIHPKPAYNIRTMVTGSYSSGTPVQFKYNWKIHKYVRYIDGVRQHAADGKLVSARNVIVQSCKVVSHWKDRDVLGNPSQFSYTVGHGGVQVFRYGKRIRGTWTRHGKHHGTILRALNGKRIPLAPGNTWVVLIRKGVHVSG